MSDMSELRSFLLARLADDERNISNCQNWAECGAGDWEDNEDGTTYGCPAHPSTSRAMTDSGSKRRIVEWPDTDEYVLELLALPYSGHPDYQREWLA